MAEKLEEIEKQIVAAKTRQSELNLKVKDLTTRLEEKRAEHAGAIRESKPASKLEAEVVSLRTELLGTKQALEKQTQILSDFQSDKKIELQAIGRAKAEEAKAESAELMNEIYSLLARCVPRIIDLNKKNREYAQGIRVANIKDIPYRYNQISSLCLRFEKELPDFFAAFPAEIFVDGDLQKPDALRKILNKK